MLRSQRPLTLDEMRDVLAPLGTAVSQSELSGGTFSAVQRVDLADGRTVVVKTSVPDHEGHDALLTYEHNLARVEADMLATLHDIDGVPAPVLLLEDFTRSRVEVDVVVSSFLEGSPWDRADAMGPQATAIAGREVGAVFARLHAVHAPTFGYPAADFRLGGATWPVAFSAILAAHVADAARFGIDVRGDELLAVLERGQDALAQVATPSLVHNDLWPGNVLLEPASGRVTGIVDWERALYGDPLMDFVGMNPFATGELAADHVTGYLAAGGSLVLDDAALQRLALYRLSVLTVIRVEVVPRGFHGDWLADHLMLMERTRDEVLAYAQDTFPA